MRRFFLLPVLLVGLLAACGDGPDVPEPTPTMAISPEPVQGLPVLGAASQALQFFGVVEGQMTTATATCAWIRGTSEDKGRLQIAIQGFFSGENHRLRIAINGYTGPGDYEWDGIDGSGPEVSVELDGAQKGHARIVVDEPGDSGDIEAILTTPNQGRITGLWECPGTPR